MASELPILLIYFLFFAGFVLGAPIIGFVYILPEANKNGLPGWLWALSTVFLSWIAVLAFLIVSSLKGYAPRD